MLSQHVSSVSFVSYDTCQLLQELKLYEFFFFKHFNMFISLDRLCRILFDFFLFVY